MPGDDQWLTITPPALQKLAHALKSLLVDAARSPHFRYRAPQGQGGLRLHLSEVPCD